MADSSIADRTQSDSDEPDASTPSPVTTTRAGLLWIGVCLVVGFGASSHGAVVLTGDPIDAGLSVAEPIADGAAGPIGRAAATTTNTSESTPGPSSPQNHTSFRISDLEDVVVPIGGVAGQTPWNGTVQVTVTNTGDRRGTTWVDMLVQPPGASAATLTDQTRVTLAAGEATSISLQPIGVISGGPGNYTIRVRANDSEVDATIAVYFRRYTHFQLGNVSADGFEAGDAGTLLVPIENTGRPPDTGPDLRPSQGPAMVSVTVNGVVVAEQRRWLTVGESDTVSLTVPHAVFAPGRNEVTVRVGAAGEPEIDDRVTFTVANETANTDGATGHGFGPFVAVVGGAAGIGIRAHRRH